MRPLEFGMSNEGNFEARLRSAFAAGEAEIVDDGFTEEVMRRAGRPDRRRFLLLGGAGSTGAAFAASQLENAFKLLPEATGWMGQAQALAGPQTMAAAVMAIMVVAFALVAPKRV